VDPKKAAQPDGPSFRQFAERFLKEHPGRRRSDHYPQTLKPIVEHFGDRPIRQITRADLDRFRIHLLTTPSSHTNRVLSPTSVVKYLRTLGRVFRMAVRWGVLEVNPATDLEMPPLPKHKPRYLSPDEFRALESAAPTWLRPILRMAVATGMRLKEVVGLRREDVDRQGKVIYIPEDSKTGMRAIPLSDSVSQILAGQIRHIRSPYVFVDSEGQPYTSEKARNRISCTTREVMRQAGIEGASFHSLRHTAAAWMVQSGVPLYEVQHVLGHSTPVMTQRYAHLQPGHLRAAVDSLDATLRASATHSATRASQGAEMPSATPPK
jgi:integrase